MAQKKYATIRRCAHFGRNKCNECDQTKHDVDDCDVLALFGDGGDQCYQFWFAARLAPAVDWSGCP